MIGWGIHFYLEYKLRKEEKEKPRSSEKLKKARNDMSDWAKQMKNFKKPMYKRPDQEQQQDDNNKD